MKAPLISVIVPVFKAEAYLDRCVQSVLDQDYPNLELILVDDGSPDRCGKMCDEWSARDHRIVVLHKKNGGQSSARNVGINHARGELLSFIDSDDWVTSDYLSYLLSLFPMERDAEAGCGFVACNHTIIRNGKRKANCDIGEEKMLLTREQAFNEVLFHGCMDVAPWGKLYKAEVFASLRFPEGRLYEDTWLFGDILNSTKTVVYGRKQCYFYEMHEGSTVNQGFREKNLEYIEAAEKLARDAINADPKNEIGGLRRVDHAKLSVLRYMEYCEERYKPLRRELRRAILSDAPRYINDPRTPRRDKVAIMLLSMGFFAFYGGWKVYTMMRT